MNDRCRFVQDDYFCWYLIPEHMHSLFCQTIDNAQVDDYNGFNNIFCEYMVEHPSFYVVEISQ